MVFAMVEAAEKELACNNRKLKPGGVVAVASANTADNTAPVLAFVCVAKDYKAKLYIRQCFGETAQD